MGYNFKYTDLQAVIGMAQLKSINSRIEKKRKIYEWYYQKKCPKDYVPWFYSLQTKDPWVTQDKLREKGIQTRIFYPPIHTQKPYYLDYGQWESTYLYQNRLWLPSSLNLTKKQVHYIRRVYENI